MTKRMSKSFTNQREKDGQTIKLTIDSGVQQQAFAIFDKRPGSAVITDPQKGDLLATVSSPSYDLIKWPMVFLKRI